MGGGRRGRTSRRNKEQRVNYHLFPFPPFKGEIKAALSCLLPPVHAPPQASPHPPPCSSHPSPFTSRPSDPRLLICSHCSSLIGDLHIHHLYATLMDTRVMPPQHPPLHSDTCYPRCLLQVLCFLFCFAVLHLACVSPLPSRVLLGRCLVLLAVSVCPFHQSVPPINHDQTHVKILLPTLLHTLLAINHSSDPSAPVGLLFQFRGPHRLSPIHHYFVCF